MDRVDDSHDFCNAVQANHERHQLNACHQVVRVERETVLSCHGLLPNGAQHQSERHEKQACGQRTVRDSGQQQQASSRHCKEFGRPEHEP